MTSLADFLQPVKGRRMKASTARAIDERVALAQHHKTRKRLKRAVASIIADAEPAASGLDGETFDRAGYNRFLKSWEAELGALSEGERFELETSVKPFFAGRAMGDEWRQILSFLKSVRARLNPEVAVVRSNLHAMGAPLRGGW